VYTCSSMSESDVLRWNQEKKKRRRKLVFHKY